MKFLKILVLFSVISTFAQSPKKDSAVDIVFFRGNSLAHTEDIYPLINGHPQGFLINYNIKTNGSEEWHRAYNKPDYGAYLLYQNFNSNPLGRCVSGGFTYNFYFLNRNLAFKLGQGISYNTNPYDKETNNKNRSFGTAITANTIIGLNYKKEYLVDNFGLQAGLLLTHYSNGRIKSPNSGLNTVTFNVGVNYNFNEKHNYKLDSVYKKVKFTEPIKYNFVLRTGINESQIIRSGQKPFYHIGFYADKRINRKSALQLGTELFLTNSFKSLIQYKSVAYPEENISANTDYKRLGVFVGHELFVNKISLEAQIGIYAYDPLKNNIPVYDRVGLKYYVNKNIFAGFTIKTHLFLAEAMEFGIGYRL